MTGILANYLEEEEKKHLKNFLGLLKEKTHFYYAYSSIIKEMRKTECYSITENENSFENEFQELKLEKKFKYMLFKKLYNSLHVLNPKLLRKDSLKRNQVQFVDPEVIEEIEKIVRENLKNSLKFTLEKVKTKYKEKFPDDTKLNQLEYFIKEEIGKLITKLGNLKSKIASKYEERTKTFDSEIKQEYFYNETRGLNRRIDNMIAKIKIDGSQEIMQNDESFQHSFTISTSAPPISPPDTPRDFKEDTTSLNGKNALPSDNEKPIKILTATKKEKHGKHKQKKETNGIRTNYSTSPYESTPPEFLNETIKVIKDISPRGINNVEDNFAFLKNINEPNVSTSSTTNNDKESRPSNGFIPDGIDFAWPLESNQNGTEFFDLINRDSSSQNNLENIEKIFENGKKENGTVLGSPDLINLESTNQNGEINGEHLEAFAREIESGSSSDFISFDLLQTNNVINGGKHFEGDKYNSEMDKVEINNSEPTQTPSTSEIQPVSEIEELEPGHEQVFKSILEEAENSDKNNCYTDSNGNLFCGWKGKHLENNNSEIVELEDDLPKLDQIISTTSEIHPETEPKRKTTLRELLEKSKEDNDQDEESKKDGTKKDELKKDKTGDKKGSKIGSLKRWLNKKRQKLFS
uniref:Uncharacterized protein n=1 Tax=Meloidogyne hapla TaxID=6305 RepID=A0A1I8BTP5_MELHA